MPVSSIASVEESEGPNQIGRENGRRRIVVYANTDGRDMGRVIGRGGRTATALRTVITALNDDRGVRIDFLDVAER